MWIYDAESKEYVNLDKMYGISIAETEVAKGQTARYPYEIVAWLTDGERFEKCNRMPIARYNSRNDAEKDMDGIYDAMYRHSSVYLLQHNAC